MHSDQSNIAPTPPDSAGQGRPALVGLSAGPLTNIGGRWETRWLVDATGYLRPQIVWVSALSTGYGR